jgi:hypothetical protein
MYTYTHILVSFLYQHILISFTHARTHIRTACMYYAPHSTDGDRDRDRDTHSLIPFVHTRIPIPFLKRDLIESMKDCIKPRPTHPLLSFI